MAKEESVLSFRIASEDVEPIRKFIERGYYSTISEFAMDSIRLYIRDMHLLIDNAFQQYTESRGEFASYLKSRIRRFVCDECPQHPESSATRPKGMQVLLNVTDEIKNALIEIDKVTLGMKSYQRIGMFAVYWNLCRNYNLHSLMNTNQNTIDKIIKRKEQAFYEIPDRYQNNGKAVWKRVDE